MIPLTIPIFYFDKGHKRSYDSDSDSDSDSVPSENQPLNDESLLILFKWYELFVD